MEPADPVRHALRRQPADVAAVPAHRPAAVRPRALLSVADGRRPCLARRPRHMVVPASRTGRRGGAGPAGGCDIHVQRLAGKQRAVPEHGAGGGLPALGIVGAGPGVGAHCGPPRPQFWGSRRGRGKPRPYAGRADLRPDPRPATAGGTRADDVADAVPRRRLGPVPVVAAEGDPPPCSLRSFLAPFTGSSRNGRIRKCACRGRTCPS